MRLFWIMLLSWLALPCAAEAQLTRAIEVRSLPYETAIQNLPVELEGTVGFIESQGTIFIQDETAGTHLHIKPSPSNLVVGDRVRVKGVTMPGLYLPGVTVSRLEVLGRGEPPEPAPATFEDLAAGRFHYQLVRVEGLVRRLTQVDENRTLLHLMVGGRLLEVRIDAPPGTAPDVVDARVTVVGLAAGGINDRRQLVFPYLRVTGWENLTVREAAAPIGKLEPVRIANLLRFGANEGAEHRVLVRGVVLAAFGDGRVFIRDQFIDEPPEGDSEAESAARAMAIQLVHFQPLAVGNVIEAAGFPVMGRFSATLADAQIVRTEAETKPVVPVETEAGELVDGELDSDLVTLTARVMNVFRTTDGYDLQLEAGEVNLRAMLAREETLPEFAPASLLRLTGICQVESSTDKGFRSRAERAVLLLRSGADVEVLQSPPWWTPGRLAVALGALAGVVLLGVVWIWMLRRQVTRQAEALSAGIGQKAALEERQRIAREFHDTLEQELAGLSLRLDAAMTRPLEEKARGLLDTSRQLVRRVQAEARNLVADLRTDPTARADLGAALRELAGRLSADDVIVVNLKLQESLPLLPAHVVHHLRMIAQEAATNALKHAHARSIGLGLSLSDGQLLMTVRDDGVGIELTQTEGQPGHFGCMGIRERMRKLNGEVEWRRQAPAGTSVEVRLAIGDV